MTRIENKQDPKKVEYRCHRVEFISTKAQKSQVMSKLKEAGLIVEETDSNAETVAQNNDDLRVHYQEHNV